MHYVRYGCQMKKRYMVILLIEELVRKSLSKVSLRNQLLVYLLAFHVKYVTIPSHLEKNSDSIRQTITAKQRKDKQGDVSERWLVQFIFEKQALLMLLTCYQA